MAPAELLFHLVFSVDITVLAGVLTLPPAGFIGVNLFFITSSAYIVTGISLAWYYSTSGNTHISRVLFVILLFTVQIVLMAVVLIIAGSLFDPQVSGQGEEIVENSDEQE